MPGMLFNILLIWSPVIFFMISKRLEVVISPLAISFGDAYSVACSGKAIFIVFYIIDSILTCSAEKGKTGSSIRIMRQ